MLRDYIYKVSSTPAVGQSDVELQTDVSHHAPVVAGVDAVVAHVRQRGVAQRRPGQAAAGLARAQPEEVDPPSLVVVFTVAAVAAFVSASRTKASKGVDVAEALPGRHGVHQIRHDAASAARGAAAWGR